MKKTLTAAAALTLVLALASCAAPQPENAPPTRERAATASASPTPVVTPTPTSIDAPVDLPEPPAVAPEPTPALAITAVEPMAFAATLDPPNYIDVFEIRDAAHGYLADTSAGPRFLLSHAMSPGNPPAPGNEWQALQEGQVIEALGSRWTITDRVEAVKSWPTDDAALVARTYGAGAGTLVLITCVPRWEGRATHNFIIIAEEAS